MLGHSNLPHSLGEPRSEKDRSDARLSDAEMIGERWHAGRASLLPRLRHLDLLQSRLAKLCLILDQGVQDLALELGQLIAELKQAEDSHSAGGSAPGPGKTLQRATLRAM